MNNKQFATFLDVSFDTLKTWLSGKHNPQPASVDYLMDLFELEGV